MRLQADAGVSPVVAVVLLMGLVAIAGAIIGLSMVAALEDAAGTLPDVRFQASADNQSLYHAGGDALPLGSLVFYNTATRQSLSSVQLTKNGQNTAEETSLAGEVWETGDKITFGADVLKALSIVGLDSRNHPALLYRGVDAAVLPIGDMVPDAWKETTPTPVPTPDVPGVVPTPVPINSEESPFHANQESFTFGDESLLEGGKGKVPLKESLTYTAKGNTPVTFVMSNNDMKKIKFFVTVYNERGEVIFSDEREVVKKNQPVAIEIKSEYLKPGYVCHVTVESYKKEEDQNPEYRDTVVITFT